MELPSINIFANNELIFEPLTYRMILASNMLKNKIDPKTKMDQNQCLDFIEMIGRYFDIFLCVCLPTISIEQKCSSLFCKKTYFLSLISHLDTATSSREESFTRKRWNERDLILPIVFSLFDLYDSNWNSFISTPKNKEWLKEFRSLSIKLIFYCLASKLVENVRVKSIGKKENYEIAFSIVWARMINIAVNGKHDKSWCYINLDKLFEKNKNNDLMKQFFYKKCFNPIGNKNMYIWLWEIIKSDFNIDDIGFDYVKIIPKISAIDQTDSQQKHKFLFYQNLIGNYLLIADGGDEILPNKFISRLKKIADSKFKSYMFNNFLKDKTSWTLQDIETTSYIITEDLIEWFKNN